MNVPQYEMLGYKPCNVKYERSCSI